MGEQDRGGLGGDSGIIETNLRDDRARVTTERDRLKSILEDWHTVVRAVGRDPGTEHETGRASDDIIDAAGILRTLSPGLSIDEAVATLLAERDMARDKCAVLLADALRLERERDAAQARLTDYFDDHRTVVAGRCAPDEMHCSCVPHLRRELKALQEVMEAAEAVAALPPAGPLDLDDQTKWLALDNAIKVIRDRKGGG